MFDQKFEVGMKYKVFNNKEHTDWLEFEVVKRTDKSIWIENKNFFIKPKRKSVRCDINNNEVIAVFDKQRTMFANNVVNREEK